MVNTLKILHLEDNLTDAHLVADILDNEGFSCDVIVVDTEKAFTEALGTSNFDFIFADYTLPSFDAFLALEIAKKLCPEIPFILVSGTIGEEIAIESLKAGADDYVLKTRLSRIVHAVRRSLKEQQEIAKRKQAERKANEQRRLFRGVVDHALDAVILVDEQNRIKVFNQAAEKMFKYTFRQIRNKDIATIIPGLFKEASLVEVKTAHVENGLLPSCYLQGMPEAGEPLELEVSLSPIFVGQMEYSAIIARDITYRLKIENELIEAKEDLEEKVRVRTSELKRTNKQLEKFAYLVSHDLREPLRMVASFIKLLKKEAAQKLNQTDLEFLEFAEDGTTRMKALLDGILEYSRVSPKANFEEIDLNKILILVKSNLKDVIKKRNAIIESEELPSIYGNRAQINQLFQNLISNAIKFCHEHDQPIIKIGYTLTKKNIEFYISDNGIGIHPNHFDNIFVIFQRVHSRKKFEGSGIGLAICKDIVTIHGGKIRVESELNVGSTFKFTLPK